MTPETLQALNDSIAHWERMSTGTSLPGESIGCRHCSLCQLFDNGDYDCEGCPVKQAGHDLCGGTPYEAAFDALYASGITNYGDPKFLKAARAELEFLRSLLPA